ncbi:MAG TPA: alpha/beta hydrolase [Lachnospiraceae bacterium]|nr:alpha/beta hydrolase [Lachnospiraceae bacterium]
MKIRKYYDGDTVLVLVHGGPGGAGSLSCMAKQYAEFGEGKICVLEPWQSAKTVWGQVEELHQQILSCTSNKVVLLGHSWGAWIVTLFASRYSDMLKSVTLMGSGPFDDRYIPLMRERRERFFQGKQREDFEKLVRELNEKDVIDKEKKFAQLAKISHGDDYDVIEEDNDCVPDGEIYNSVWPEGAKMRTDGQLIEEAKKIDCPIYIIHGTEDPHPLEGIIEPFNENGIKCTVYTLDRCGHSPWKEKNAKDSLREIIFSRIINE